MTASDSAVMLKLSNALAETAPVTKRSGKSRHVHQRWACGKHFRHALHLFAEQSLSRCVWAERFYQHHREKDRSHANALRRLGMRAFQNRSST